MRFDAVGDRPGNHFKSWTRSNGDYSPGWSAVITAESLEVARKYINAHPLANDETEQITALSLNHGLP